MNALSEKSNLNILVALALTLLFALSVSAAAQTLNASAMVYKSSGTSMADGSHVLNQNGYLGTFVYVSDPGQVTFTIVAKGDAADGLQASMHLHVGECKAAWFVTNTYSYYTATFDLPAGTFALRIEFSNDLVKNGQDRNLYMRTLTVVNETASASLLNVSSDENALAAADTYIENYRRGPVTVTILDAEGKPFPAGTTVRAKLKNHVFNFGTCVPGAYGDLWWTNPNPTAGSDTEKYQKFINSHFNMITPEACGKWGYQEANRDVVILDYLDAYLNYAESHGLRARMHTLLWDYDTAEPAWVNDLQNRAAAGDIAAANELRAEITERIDYMVTQRSHRYAELDCINETSSHPMFTTIYGLSGVAGIINETVAASNGRARVYVNEWNEMKDGNYAEWYRRHIQSILDAGGMVEGIGCQTNLDSRYPTSANTFHRNLQNLDNFELPISTTEYRCTMGGDTVKQMNLAMRLMFGNEMTTTFLMWGFWRNAIYSPNNEILVNADWTLSACGIEYERLMALWSTDETRMTDNDSRIQFTGYYGDYDIIINGQVYSLKLVKGTETYQLVTNPSMLVDTFERNNSTNLGVTEDAGHKAWVKGAGESYAAISSKQLQLSSATTSGSGVGIGDNYTPADFDLKANLYISGIGSNWAGIAYRQAQVGSSSSGYTVRFLAKGTHALLQLPDSTIVSSVIISPALIWTDLQHIRIKVTGTRHEVWVGSVKVIDHIDGSKVTGGYVNFVRSSTTARIDNLVIAQYQPLSPVTVTSPKQIKTQPERALVDLYSPIVTRTFNGFFYVEDQNRQSGIKVVSPKAVSENTVVNISGITGTVDGEYLINAWDVQSFTSVGAIKPFGMNNRTLGGGLMGSQPAVSDGLSNIGLLTRVYGRVTQVDPGGSYFYVDDGSGLSDGTLTSGQNNRGVRVTFDGRGYSGKYVAINGISSCFKGSDGKLKRLIRVSKSGDIKILQ